MDLINLALKFRDFEWVEELLKLENEKEAPEIIMEEGVKADLFGEESIALENITNTYAVKEKMGIRAFNINSEYDRNMSDLVLVEKPSYKRGETVRYHVPSNEELIFARGMVNGYLMGYGEANNHLNSQLMEYFSAFESQENKKKSTVGTNNKKAVKTRKSKEQNNKVE